MIFAVGLAMASSYSATGSPPGEKVSLTAAQFVPATAVVMEQSFEQVALPANNLLLAMAQDVPNLEAGSGENIEQGDPPIVGDTPVQGATETNFLLDNWGALLMGLLTFAEVVVRLTPSEKDNSIFNWLYAFITAFVPNLKKGGGTFRVASK